MKPQTVFYARLAALLGCSMLPFTPAQAAGQLHANASGMETALFCGDYQQTSFKELTEVNDCKSVLLTGFVFEAKRSCNGYHKFMGGTAKLKNITVTTRAEDKLGKQTYTIQLSGLSAKPMLNGVKDGKIVIYSCFDPHGGSSGPYKVGCQHGLLSNTTGFPVSWNAGSLFNPDAFPKTSQFKSKQWEWSATCDEISTMIPAPIKLTDVVVKPVSGTQLKAGGSVRVQLRLEAASSSLYLADDFFYRVTCRRWDGASCDWMNPNQPAKVKLQPGQKITVDVPGNSPALNAGAHTITVERYQSGGQYTKQETKPFQVGASDETKEYLANLDYGYAPPTTAMAARGAATFFHGGKYDGKNIRVDVGCHDRDFTITERNSKAGKNVFVANGHCTVVMLDVTAVSPGSGVKGEEFARQTIQVSLRGEWDANQRSGIETLILKGLQNPALKNNTSFRDGTITSRFSCPTEVPPWATGSACNRISQQDGTGMDNKALKLPYTHALFARDPFRPMEFKFQQTTPGGAKPMRRY